MADPRLRLTDVAAAIADRAAIDWVAREQESDGADDLALLRELKVLDELAWVFREECGADQDVHPGTPPDVEPGDAVEATWGDLGLVEIIGRGAFGVVYRAWDAKLARDVAVKLLPDDRASGQTPGVIEEGRLLARVRHPHVVTVYGADRREGQVGIWMELVRGRTLEAIVREHGPFGAAEAALIGQHVCSALAAVHQAGLLHRDVKAQNVMRETGGRIVLMDLGAGLEQPRDDTAAVDPAGTPAYMAPELFARGQPSVQSDLYSVGMLLFRLLTGGNVVEAATVRDLREAHAARRRRRLRDVRPDVPASLERVVERALSLDPADRYESAAAMEHALISALGHVASAVEPAALAPGGWRGRLTRPAPVWATALLMAASAAVAILVMRWASRVTPAHVSGGAAAAATPGAVEPLSDDERRIWTGYEELAANHIAAGNWAEARTLFGRIHPIFYKKWGADTPMIGYSMAREMWMAHLAGDPTAGDGLDMALYKLEQELGPQHPYVITTLMAKAAVLQDEARYVESAETLVRALDRRSRLMRRLGGGGLVKAGPPIAAAARWQHVLKTARLAADADGDWLPDAVEVVLGTDPLVADTDGDGTTDGEEDHDGDGWANCVEGCQGWDPTKVLAHAGAVDPVRLGFGTIRPFTSRPADGPEPGWHISTTHQQGYYYWSLPDGLKRAAMTRGWRYLSAGAVAEGTAWIQLDLSPHSGRWDLGVEQTPASVTSVRLVSKVLPPAGATLDVGRGGRWPVMGLEYDPARRQARQLADWRARDGWHDGHRQFLEGLGLVFGAHNSLGNAARGDARFSLVMFEVR